MSLLTSGAIELSFWSLKRGKVERSNSHKAAFEGGHLSVLIFLLLKPNGWRFWLYIYHAPPQNKPRSLASFEPNTLGSISTVLPLYGINNLDDGSQLLEPLE
ncbi:hypothetical protein CEXT_498721 [Caerostris extrusa]|uniref:Uncharacterized protein n=1 Tax=Caerostris extrusa TaxID=172846 RepID=A0AAV4NCD7_CAEEX|nr:hypothetical protein CEXT_498721 [Caerostris extrusa]